MMAALLRAAVLLLWCAATASLTAGLTAASLGAAVPAGGVPGLPLPVVLVDEGFVLMLKERLKNMAAHVKATQKEAQYQVRGGLVVGASEAQRRPVRMFGLFTGLVGRLMAPGCWAQHTCAAGNCSTPSAMGTWKRGGGGVLLLLLRSV